MTSSFAPGSSKDSLSAPSAFASGNACHAETSSAGETRSPQSVLIVSGSEPDTHCTTYTVQSCCIDDASWLFQGAVAQP